MRKTCVTAVDWQETVEHGFFSHPGETGKTTGIVTALALSWPLRISLIKSRVAQNVCISTEALTNF